MNKNIKLIYCIIGSFILALLRTPIFDSVRNILFEGSSMGYEANIFTKFIYFSTNIISFCGFLLTIVFCIALIINNILKKY